MRPAAKLRLSRLLRSKGRPLRWTQSGMEVGMDSEAGAELLEHHWETWNIDVPTYHILFSRTLDLMYSLGIRTRMERSFRLFLISSLARFSPHEVKHALDSLIWRHFCKEVPLDEVSVHFCSSLEHLIRNCYLRNSCIRVSNRCQSLQCFVSNWLRFLSIGLVFMRWGVSGLR